MDQGGEFGVREETGYLSSVLLLFYSLRAAGVELWASAEGEVVAQGGDAGVREDGGSAECPVLLSYALCCVLRAAGEAAAVCVSGCEVGSPSAGPLTAAGVKQWLSVFQAVRWARPVPAL